MTEVLTQGTKAVKRRSTLEPYLLKVQEVLRREPFDPNRSRRLSIDGVAISLEPWVVVTVYVEPQFGAPDGDTVRAELVGQSLALWLKSALDVRSLRREIQNGSSNLYAEQAKLMLDSALGATLLQELQRCSDGFVQRGDLEEAKRLSKFRGQVSGLVRELKQVISESNAHSTVELDEPVADVEVIPAPSPSPSPTHVPAPSPAPSAVAKSVARQPDQGIHRPVRRPRPAPVKPRAPEPAPKTSSYRTQILVGLNILAIAASIRLSAPTVRQGETPPALAAQDFGNATALVEIVARPPTLYATVDETIWSSYDHDQQQRFLDSMGSVLRSHGYGGLALKSSDGRLVGQWLEKGGTKLLPIVPDGGLPPAPATGQYSRFVP